jgi:hypothetical protein
MSTKKPEPDPFMSIDPTQLANVSGGAARVTARSTGANDEVLQMLSSIGDSIKSLASAGSNSGGGDMMQMMMMMMMMGGGGGGASAAAAAPAPAPPQQVPVINISTNVRRC